MKIIGIDIKKYSLPLKMPLALKGQHVDCREGAFVFLTTSTGVVGVGEIAVLPQLHKESLGEAIDNLLRIKDAVIDMDVVFGFCDDMLPDNALPSVRLAIEMAVMDIVRQQGDLFADLPVLSLPLNGLLKADADNIFDEIDALLDDGYSSIKIKVGARPLKDDIETISRAIERVGQKATLRLDANRSWTLDDAVCFCNEIGQKGIEYVEEPLRDTDGYPGFFSRCDMPVALDESLVDCDIESLPDLGQIEAFVLKPSLLGGFAETARLVNLARENSITPVISCTFQTSFTLAMFALFAAKLGIVDIPLGLDTSKFFAEDILVHPLCVVNGRVDLASILKHGLELKSEKLTCLQ